MEFQALREEVFEVTQLCCSSNLIRLSLGNISAHDGEGHVAITPAGARYDTMKPEDIPIIDLDGNMIDGAKIPSSETLMHTAILKNMPEMRGVAHTHSVYATTISAMNIEIPPVCIEIKSVGGGPPIPAAPYVVPYTEEAGLVAVEMFREHPGLKCMMMRHHGLVAVGTSMYDAYANAYKFEFGAEIYYRSLQLGTPLSLSPEQVAEMNQTYADFKERYAKDGPAVKQY
jgi:L-ribulose-5-phosphate 4-epimerase